MKLYMLEMVDPNDGTLLFWYGSMEEAKAMRQEMSQGRDATFEIRRIYLPIRKAEMVSFLNQYAYALNG